MECIDENAATLFVAGQMGDAEAEALEAHVDQCPECLALLAALAKTATIAPFDPHTEIPLPRSEALRRGSRVGRYEIESLVGIGAMGTVYAALDPDLRRAVALKLVRASVRDDAPDRTDRLLREARTMAKLVHPNVVAVHDVGTYDHRVFVAMDLVDGKTLGQWLAQEPRSVKEILDAFAEAGKGLAAAHEAGVVHRDFKPDNVLVGKDRRVVVTDFGLAGEPGEERRGQIAGTPAYMAPEQLRGDEVDARADQFGFSVALHEALDGERPFAGKTTKDLLAAIEAGRMRDARRAPAHVRRALRRGLAQKAEDRFPSMTALLRELGTDPRATLRRGVIVALVALGVVSAVISSAVLVHRERAVCREAVPAKLIGVWDPPKRATIEAAFRATKVPYADDAWTRVARALDAQADAWTAMHVDACDATHVRAEQSAALLDLRVACLGERLGEMRALTDVLAHADGDVVKNATAAVTSLTPLARCADARTLREIAPPPADRALRIAEIAGDIARAKALRDSGRVKESVDVATIASKSSADVGYGPLLAAAYFRLGDSEVSAGDAASASRALARSAEAADESRDDAMRARALSERLFVEGYMLRGSTDRISEIDGQAAAAIARIGGDEDLEGDRLHALGMSLLAKGSFAEAASMLDRATATREKVHGLKSRQVAMSRNGLCLVTRKRGDLEGALLECERAVAIWTEVLGPSHPDVALGMSNVAALLVELGRLDEACPRLERSFEISEAALGPSHPQSAMTLGNLGECYADRGQYDRAIAAQLRVLAMREKQLGETNPRVATTLTNLGRAYVGIGDFASASTVLERALRIETDATDPEEKSEASFALARTLWELGGDERRRRAKNLALDARKLLTKETPESHAIDAWLSAHP